jgi:hypothetical protein
VGEKFEPGHLEVCTKKNKPQLHALALNDLDREISEEALNEMAIEDLITEDFCQLSLNAVLGAEANDSIKLKATVKNKTMLILVDTCSSHSFVGAQFAKFECSVCQVNPTDHFSYPSSEGEDGKWSMYDHNQIGQKPDMVYTRAFLFKGYDCA